MGFFKNLFGGKKDDADDAPFVSEDMLERQEWSKEQWQDKVKDYNREYGHILKAKYLSDGVIRLDTKVNGGWQKLYSDWLIGKSPIFVRDDLSATVYQEFEELREKNIYLPREITNSLLGTDYPISSH